MYFEKIVDVATGEETLREFTEKEISAIEKEQAKLAKEAKAQSDKAKAREDVLKSIGLTEEQIQALIG
jgi:hypothetical protein